MSFQLLTNFSSSTRPSLFVLNNLNTSIAFSSLSADRSTLEACFFWFTKPSSMSDISEESSKVPILISGQFSRVDVDVDIYFNAETLPIMSFSPDIRLFESVILGSLRMSICKSLAS